MFPTLLSYYSLDYLGLQLLLCVRFLWYCVPVLCSSRGCWIEGGASEDSSFRFPRLSVQRIAQAGLGIGPRSTSHNVRITTTICTVL